MLSRRTQQTAWCWQDSTPESLSPLGSLFEDSPGGLTVANMLGQNFRSQCFLTWQLWFVLYFFLAFLSSYFILCFSRMTHWESEWCSVTSVMKMGSPLLQVTTINISQPSMELIPDAFPELPDLVLSFTIHGDEFIEWLWLCMSRTTEINGH